MTSIKFASAVEFCFRKLPVQPGLPTQVCRRFRISIRFSRRFSLFGRAGRGRNAIKEQITMSELDSIQPAGQILGLGAAPAP